MPTIVFPNRLKTLKARRKLWLEVHLWLGLGLGLFLAIIGLTGSVLVFWHELDEALNPALFEAAPNNGAIRKPIDDIIAAAELSAPKGWDSVWLDAAQENQNYILGFYYSNASSTPEQAESLNIAINPYTAEVVGKRVFYHASNPLKHSFVGFFFKLHYAMFLGETGVTIVGVLGVLFIISVLSGLILWWPLTGNWRRVLTIKRRASIERFNHDLHQTAGFYSLIVLLAVLMSGVYFNLPNQFRWLVERFSALTPEAQPIDTTSDSPAVLQTALQQASPYYQGGNLQFLTFTGDKHGLMTACYKDIPELQPYILSNRCLVLNRADGKLLQITDPKHGSAGDVFMQWQWPLHSGQAFGWTGRILVFLSGLACPVLFVTGVIRWLQKRRAKKYMTLSKAVL